MRKKGNGKKFCYDCQAPLPEDFTGHFCVNCNPEQEIKYPDELLDSIEQLPQKARGK